MCIRDRYWEDIRMCGWSVYFGCSWRGWCWSSLFLPRWCLLHLFGQDFVWNDWSGWSKFFRWWSAWSWLCASLCCLSNEWLQSEDTLWRGALLIATTLMLVDALWTFDLILKFMCSSIDASESLVFWILYLCGLILIALLWWLAPSSGRVYSVF